MGWRLACLGVIGVLVVPAVLLGCSGQQRDEATLSAAPTSRPCPAVKLTRTADQRAGIEASNRDGTWRLTGARWYRNAPSPLRYPVRSDSWTRGCVVGGNVVGNVPRSWTRDQWYDAEDGGTRMGGEAFRHTMTAASGNFLRIVNASVQDYEDAFDPNSAYRSSTTYLDHVRASNIRDDCIENEDVPHHMVVVNSLLDGCFTAFAQRPSGSESTSVGKGPQTFTVLDSLVYINPQPLGRNYCSADRARQGRCRPTAREGVWLGAYGIWKWSDQAAGKVTVRDTIFRLDLPSYSSCRPQKWPPGTYENVTLVWTGRGEYRTAGGCTNRLPAGVRLTRDIRVWNSARAAWLNR